MQKYIFDEYAEKYDSWFLKNKNVLDSEVALMAFFLKSPGRSLSVGCGSGLFETLLSKDYNITIKEGVEPAEGMREIAIKRGMTVRLGTAEDTIFGDNEFDTINFNGTPSYISNLSKAFKNAYDALKIGGTILVLDVPKESSYGLLYQLGKYHGSWDHPDFIDVTPENIYPIEFVKEAQWRSTPEKTRLLKKIGFTNFRYAQTLTKHPAYSNLEKETPIAGYDRGDYVAICAQK